MIRLFSLLMVAAVWTWAATPAADPTRPNIIVILSDDMGFSDLGCYGGEINTPNLDALAAGGLRFTQFYNNARCCPTRASLLTGLYPHRAGVGHMMEDMGPTHPGYRGTLDRACRTTAQVLKPAGYGTYAIGKWHVTRFAGPEGPKNDWPLARGFDRYYGTIHGAGSYYDPSSLVRDDTMISPYADPEYRPRTYYHTDAITDHAVRFVSEHARDHGRQLAIGDYRVYLGVPVPPEFAGMAKCRSSGWRGCEATYMAFSASSTCRANGWPRSHKVQGRRSTSLPDSSRTISTPWPVTSNVTKWSWMDRSPATDVM
jgi:arylsulfatase